MLAAALAELMKARSALPQDKMSTLDKTKLLTLTGLLQKQAREYGFSTFNPDELTIDEDTYRPQKEGYEIGFETSASDAIRLKWAYQLGLLDSLICNKPITHACCFSTNLGNNRLQKSASVDCLSALRHASAEINRSSCPPARIWIRSKRSSSRSNARKRYSPATSSKLWRLSDW